MEWTERVTRDKAVHIYTWYAKWYVKCQVNICIFMRHKMRKSKLALVLTLHPWWRRLLAFIGQSTRCTFTGHPHDWVVQLDGSDPVPLASTYREPGYLSGYKHLEVSVVDTLAWNGDDPRYVPPINVAAPLANCHACGQTQSDDPEQNHCCCFPWLFGRGLRRPASVQVFRTRDGRNNGLIMALTSVERGAAIGKFVGLITKGVEDLNVMNASTGVAVLSVDLAGAARELHALHQPQLQPQRTVSALYLAKHTAHHFSKQEHQGGE